MLALFRRNASPINSLHPVKSCCEFSADRGEALVNRFSSPIATLCRWR